MLTIFLRIEWLSWSFLLNWICSLVSKALRVIDPRESSFLVFFHASYPKRCFWPTMPKYGNLDPDPLKDENFKIFFYDCNQLSNRLPTSPQPWSGDHFNLRYWHFSNIWPSQPTVAGSAASDEKCKHTSVIFLSRSWGNDYTYQSITQNKCLALHFDYLILLDHFTCFFTYFW